MLTSALTIALVVLPARAQGVPLDDPRWAPWLGCWRLVQDDYEPPAAATASPGETLVCVYPASANPGVGVTTFVGARTVAQTTVVADGAERQVSQPGCDGSQQSEWSLTGQQLLTRGEIACHGQPARTISGITLMSGGPTWLNIQAVGTDQDARIRVRRYQRAGSPPRRRGLTGRPAGVGDGGHDTSRGSNLDDARRSHRRVWEDRSVGTGGRTTRNGFTPRSEQSPGVRRGRCARGRGRPGVPASKLVEQLRFSVRLPQPASCGRCAGGTGSTE
jgi:hypothetical protein